MNNRICNNLLIMFALIVLSSCTTTSASYNVQNELSKVEKCREVEPFFTKSRVCLKQSVIASEVIFPELVNDMENLTDLLEERLNQNKIANEMAWKLFEDNLVLATEAMTNKDVVRVSASINSFMETIQ
tara:strand:+ start:94 stop:480 length:387 start_codon:yes stop_codon:yes gene_type:complete